MKKILIVDDEPDIVKLIKFRLETNGYEVMTSYDGEEALGKVSNEKPDLIILDITLPRIDGYKVCSILKSDERYKDIPVIMLTGCTEFNEIKTGMDLGAVSYIQKPFKADTLLGIIRGLIGK